MMSPGAAGLLETCGDVDGIPGDEHLSAGGVAGHHLACVDTRADADAHAVLRLQLGIERLDGLVQFGHRTHCSQRIVLVDGRDAEDGHDCVPDELLDAPTVALERPRRGVEVAPHDPARRFGVELSAETGRLGDVREDNGHRLARLARLSLNRHPQPPKGGTCPRFECTGHVRKAPGRRRRWPRSRRRLDAVRDRS
jgi:hypothetical protein